MDGIQYLRDTGFRGNLSGFGDIDGREFTSSLHIALWAPENIRKIQNMVALMAQDDLGIRLLSLPDRREISDVLMEKSGHYINELFHFHQHKGPRDLLKYAFEEFLYDADEDPYDRSTPQAKQRMFTKFGPTSYEKNAHIKNRTLTEHRDHINAMVAVELIRLIKAAKGARDNYRRIVNTTAQDLMAKRSMTTWEGKRDYAKEPKATRRRGLRIASPSESMTYEEFKRKRGLRK